jgi:hypothetical protein
MNAILPRPTLPAEEAGLEGIITDMKLLFASLFLALGIPALLEAEIGEGR